MNEKYKFYLIGFVDTIIGFVVASIGMLFYCLC